MRRPRRPDEVGDDASRPAGPAPPGPRSRYGSPAAARPSMRSPPRRRSGPRPSPAAPGRRGGARRRIDQVVPPGPHERRVTDDVASAPSRSTIRPMSASGASGSSTSISRPFGGTSPISRRSPPASISAHGSPAEVAARGATVDRPTLGDAAEVERDALGESETSPVELDVTRSPRAGTGAELHASAGHDLVEVPVVAGGDQRVEQRGIEAASGPRPSVECHPDQLRERLGDGRPRSGTGVDPRELAVAAEPRAPKLLAFERGADGGDGGLERPRSRGSDASDARPHRPELGQDHRHHEPPVDVAAGVELTGLDPEEAEPPGT